MVKVVKTGSGLFEVRGLDTRSVAGEEILIKDLQHQIREARRRIRQKQKLVGSVQRQLAKTLKKENP